MEGYPRRFDGCRFARVLALLTAGLVQQHVA